MKNTKSIIGRLGRLFLLLPILVHVFLFFLIKDHGMMMDEHYHFRQIVRFMGGDFTPDPELPMTAGYHFIMAGAGKLLGFENYLYYGAASYFRTVSFIFGILAIILFYIIVKKIDRKSSRIKTLQFSFFPLIFMYFYILYTDIFSLLILFISFLFIINKRIFIGAIIGSLSIWVRQNNLIWLLFFNLLLYLGEYGYVLNGKSIKKHIQKTSIFLLGPLFFGIYLLINGRLSMGEETYVNFTLLHPSNIYLILFSFLVLFFPIVLERLGDVVIYAKKRIVYLIFLLVFAPIFIVSFTNTHPYNQGTFFIHNAVAVFFTQDVFHKLMLFIFVVLALLGLRIIPLIEREYYLLYIFTLIFLLPLWFIESRYYIVPFSFFMLFRKTESIVVELSLLLLFASFSLFIYAGIYSWKLFL